MLINRLTTLTNRSKLIFNSKTLCHYWKFCIPFDYCLIISKRAKEKMNHFPVVATLEHLFISVAVGRELKYISVCVSITIFSIIVVECHLEDSVFKPLTQANFAQFTWHNVYASTHYYFVYGFIDLSFSHSLHFYSSFLSLGLALTSLLIVELLITRAFKTPSRIYGMTFPHYKVIKNERKPP